MQSVVFRNNFGKEVMQCLEQQSPGTCAVVNKHPPPNSTTKALDILDNWNSNTDM